jgi:hypothetical protein
MSLSPVSPDLPKALPALNLQAGLALSALTIYSNIRIYAIMKMNMSKMLAAADDASGLLKALGVAFIR